MRLSVRIMKFVGNGSVICGLGSSDDATSVLLGGGGWLVAVARDSGLGWVMRDLDAFWSRSRSRRVRPRSVRLRDLGSRCIGPSTGHAQFEVKLPYEELAYTYGPPTMT
jgi:hypothetical protein